LAVARLYGVIVLALYLLAFPVDNVGFGGEYPSKSSLASTSSGMRLLKRVVFVSLSLEDKAQAGRIKA
jgi:hypothetical protein